MKTKLFLISVLIIIFSSIAFAQNKSVTLTSKKVTYQRTGEDVPDHKKTFEVNYPLISGISDIKIKNNIENTIDYWKNFDTNLDENLGEYYWLESLEYSVNYNNNSIFDIELIMEGSGAYPSTSVKTLVIDLNTGKRVAVADLFTDIGQLLVKIDAAQRAEITKAKAEAKKQGEDIKSYLSNSNNKINKLEEFSIDENGVIFIFDYGFPHAAKALEPDGRYFFTWAELKPLIKRDGLLGQFVR